MQEDSEGEYFAREHPKGGDLCSGQSQQAKSWKRPRETKPEDKDIEKSSLRHSAPVASGVSTIID
jgi:hypothetical protein